MKAVFTVLILVIFEFTLLAQPSFIQDNRFIDLDTLFSSFDQEDSLWKYIGFKQNLKANSSHRIGQRQSNGYPIVSYVEYVYTSRYDSLPYERGEGVFDEYGNLIYLSQYWWDLEEKDWNLWEKREYYYDDFGRDTSILVYQMHLPGGDMVLTYKWATRYNEIGYKMYDINYVYYSHTDSWTKGIWEFSYTQSGSLLSADYYYMASDMDNRLHVVKLKQTCDENDNLLSRELYGLDKDLNWTGNEKMEWDYDASGNQIQEIVYVWDEGVHDWLPGRKSECQYDALGNICLVIVYSNDNYANKWILSRRLEFSINMHGNTTSKVCLKYDSLLDTWIGAYKFDYKYDSYGRETESIQYNWDDLISDWIQISKKEVNYNPTIVAVYFWDKNLNEWVGNWKREMMHNAYDAIIFEGEYDWDSLSNNWFMQEGHIWERTYDVSGKETACVIYTWNLDRVEWDLTRKDEWTYDEEGNLLILANFVWKNDKSEWGLQFRTFYTCRQGFVTDIPENNLEVIEIYPNPADSFVRIDGLLNPATVEIYSIMGNRLFQKSIFNGPVDISILPLGVYILVIHSDGKHILSRKFVKQ